MGVTVHADKAAGKAADGPRLALIVDGKKRSVAPNDVRGPAGAKLVEEFGKRQVSVTMDNLLGFSDTDRLALLDFLCAFQPCEFRVGQTAFTNPLEAVLAVFPADADLETARKARLAALEVTAFRYADALDVACDTVLRRMRELKYAGCTARELRKDAEAILGRLRVAARAAGHTISTVKAVLPTAPVSDAVVVPGRWVLSPQDIRCVGDGAAAISAPVVVTGVSRDVQHGHELVTVAWWRGERWQQATVDRKVVANKNAILELASHGLPVYSGNAAALVQYLHDFLVDNQPHLTTRRASGQLGWQEPSDGEVFLWGPTPVTAAEVGGADVGSYQFRGADAGDDQLAAGFHSAGSYDGWLRAIRRIRDYIHVRFGLYASFVPPLLGVFDSENFVVDFAGATSQGKTTTLRVAASVWGRPERGSRRGTTLYDWNTTQTWRERAPAVMNHLPLILDDSKTVRHPDEIAQTVYTFTQGRGRGRGTVAGLAQQTGFRSVLISSGERPVVSFGEHGGTRPRVLTLSGSPFGGTDEKTGRRVVRINRLLSDHYGHAGPRFVAYLARNRHRWDYYKECHANWTERYTEQANGNAVAGRMAAHFAAIVYASRLAHAALDLPWEWENPVDPLNDELTKEAAEADRAAVALRHAIGWAVANRNSFFRLKADESAQPYSGWAGRWDRDGDLKSPGVPSKWEYIGFMPQLLFDVLSKSGFEVDPVLRVWKDRGWLRTQDGRNQFKVKLGREQAWMVAVTRQAVEGVADLGTE